MRKKIGLMRWDIRTGQPKRGDSEKDRRKALGQEELRTEEAEDG